MKTTFGQYLRSLRAARALGLRQFARDVGMQPSNYSNMENGFLKAPGDAALKNIATVLRLADGFNKRKRLFDLAARARADIPVDSREFTARHPLVPAMLRSIKDKRLSRAHFQALLDHRDAMTEPCCTR